MSASNLGRHRVRINMTRRVIDRLLTITVYAGLALLLSGCGGGLPSGSVDQTLGDGTTYHAYWQVTSVDDDEVTWQVVLRTAEEHPVTRCKFTFNEGTTAVKTLETNPSTDGNLITGTCSKDVDSITVESTVTVGEGTTTITHTIFPKSTVVSALNDLTALRGSAFSTVMSGPHLSPTVLVALQRTPGGSDTTREIVLIISVPDPLQLFYARLSSDSISGATNLLKEWQQSFPDERLIILSDIVDLDGIDFLSLEIVSFFLETVVLTCDVSL